MTLPTRLCTVKEFEEFIARRQNRDRSFELIHGVIVEKTLNTELHGVIVVNIVFYVELYARAQKRGRLGVSVRNRTPNDDYNSRQPDISYFTDTSRPIVTTGAVPQMPDLAVEVKSPDDSYKAMRERADYYLANGAQMVWLILTEKQTIEVHEPRKITILTVDDTLDGGELLPGFTLTVRTLFPANT